jgi:hypothetical protein
MIPRRAARFCLLAAAMFIARPSSAGVWGAQPVIGVSGDYATNPALLNLPNTSESHAALLLDAPTTYNGDAFKFSILPSFRLSDTQGYSSLDSDYAHLNVTSEFDTARSALTLSAGLARDSSLYHDYILDGAAGVRRDSATADVNWDRHLTERLEFATDAGWSRVRYAAAEGVGILTDYKYTSVTPSLVWDESERIKLTATASAGRYNSLDGSTQSTNASLQLGFVKKLTEIWSLSASGGYSRASNELDFTEFLLEFNGTGFVLVPVPINLKSSQNGSVFSASLSRQTELLTFTADASRKLVPSGFAFLSLQRSYGAHVSFIESAKWVLGGDVHWIQYQNPPRNDAAAADVKVSSISAFATCQWTEHWTVTMNVSRITERYAPSATNTASTGISVQVARHFDWKQFQ